MTNGKDRTANGRRLVIVSNRLPFTVQSQNGEIRFQESTGGLVTGLMSVLHSSALRSVQINSCLWVGWPGATVEEQLQASVSAHALAEHNALPVFLSEDEMENFYHGFCNKTIWPLFHYFPTYALYEDRYWQHYKRVNAIFCNALMRELQPNDIVWIHDYHLMLLPKLLRASSVNIPVGFFLHIPFPSFEMYRLLPEEWRAEILEGMLGADLIGFHTYEYTQHFLQSVLRILGYEHQLGQVSLPLRTVRAETFPMGIDYQKYAAASDNPGVILERQVVAPSLRGLKVILSVDRLDYSKGILNRLEAFETFLEQYPQFQSKVVLIVIIVPSRIMVEHYEQMKRSIEEYVGRINGKFSTLNWTPIIYQYKQLSYEPLAALYTLSDVALITPLRDGMNLIAKEYIASISDMMGVLILSEMAGAAQELRESLIINPNDRQVVARAMKEALEMPPEEQQRRNRIMQDRLRRYDVLRWSNDFVSQLLNTAELQNRLNAKLLRQAARTQIITGFKNADCRLLLLDYDGTLVPLARRPEYAAPKPNVLQLLKQLAAVPRNRVVIASGRDRRTLDAWFGEIGINLVAEHGAWMKENHNDWKTVRQLTNDWKAQIMPILQLYADRLPGAFIEEKEFSLAWHYRTTDPEQSAPLARQLSDHLTTFTANIDIQVLHGSKVIEVRNAGINKGTAALHWLLANQYDFILAIGDDWTDEELFNVLPPNAHSIRVGVTTTRAKYNLHYSSEVIRLLEELSQAS